MTEILYAGPVALEKMPQIVAACHFEPEALFLAENIPTHLIITQKERQELLCFKYVGKVMDENGDVPCAKYTTGRIFQDDRELRWERQKETLRVVYLGPADNNAEAIFLEYGMKNKEEDLAALEKSQELKYYALFGERIKEADLRYFGKTAQPGDFAVVRIPRVLSYPIKPDDEPAARLLVCEYHNKATGSVDLFRFQELETWNDKKRGVNV
jgi:hypothetical protein